MSLKELAKKKINLDQEEIKEGEEIILTLADQQILDKNGKYNEDLDDDQLENIEKNEDFKLKQRDIMRDKSKMLAYTSQNDKKSILPQYDELKIEKKGIILDESGKFEFQSRKQQLEIRIQQESQDKISKNVIAQEYETVKQTKNLFGKKIKKNNKNNLLSILEEQAEEEQAKNQILNEEDDIMGGCIQQDQQNAPTDYGNRETISFNSIENERKREEENQQQKQKKENYLNAIMNAQKQQRDSQKRNKQLFQEDDQDYQLELALQKQRKLKMKQEMNEQVLSKDEEIKKLLEDNREQSKIIEEKQEQMLNDVKIILPPKPKKKGEKMEKIDEIKADQDFLKNVDTAEQQKTHQIRQTLEFSEKYSFKDAQGTQSVVNVSLPSERIIGMTKKREELDNQLPDMSNQLDDATREQLKMELDFMYDKQEVGISGTIKRLMEMGALGKDQQDYSGRYKDRKPHDEGLDGADNDRIKLEYRDESGKIMTKKQAFRYACWIFHGKGPGKNKLEKLKKKENQQQKIREKAIVGQTVLSNALKMSQEKGQLYLLLSTQQQSQQQNN